jgi:hypothetical protein
VPSGFTTSSAPAELHAAAHQLDREVVLRHAHALIVGHEIPPLQGVGSNGCGVGQFDPHRHLHRGPLQADADELHAVVGFDEHLGEVAPRGHALHGHRLGPERLAHASHDLVGAPLRIHLADRAEVVLHLREALLRRIDRTAHEPILRLAWRKAPQGRRQILEQQRGAAGLGAHHAAGGIGDPGLRRAGDHDLTRAVALGRIDEHVLDAGQAGELRHVVGHVPRAAGRSRRLEPREGYLAERHRFLQIARQRLHGGLSLLGGEAGIGDAARPQHPFGVDRHAGGVIELPAGLGRHQAGDRHGEGRRTEMDAVEPRNREHGDHPGRGVCMKRGNRPGG